MRNLGLKSSLWNNSEAGVLEFEVARSVGIEHLGLRPTYTDSNSHCRGQNLLKVCEVEDVFTLHCHDIEDIGEVL